MERLFNPDFLSLETLMFLKAASGGSLNEYEIIGNPVAFSTNVVKPLAGFTIPFLPVQAGSGDPSPDNVRSISGFSSANLWRTGKNMAEVIGYSASSVNDGATGQTTNSYGTTISTTGKSNELVVTQSTSTTDYAINSYRNGYVVVRLSPLVFGREYDISFDITNITSNPLEAGLSDVIIVKPSGVSVNQHQIVGNTLIFKNVKLDPYSNGTRTTFDIRICGMSFTLSNVMITPANESDGVYEPYTGQSYPVTFPYGQTIYGGTLDAVNGVLTVEWAGFSKTWGDGESATDMGSGITRKVFPMVDYLTTGAANNMCNIAPYQSSENASTHFYYSGSGSTNRKCRVFLPSDTPDTTEITVITKLSQTHEIQLDPITVQTLIGDNTIWTDTNGENTVKYKKKG